MEESVDAEISPQATRSQVPVSPAGRLLQHEDGKTQKKKAKVVIALRDQEVCREISSNGRRVRGFSAGIPRQPAGRPSGPDRGMRINGTRHALVGRERGCVSASLRQSAGWLVGWPS